MRARPGGRATRREDKGRFPLPKGKINITANTS
nr:MAG TPA: hypothetical protein [Caudoviricetes sp.]